MRARDLMRHRYVLGDVRQTLALVDRMIHSAYDREPNREVDRGQRERYADTLWSAASKLMEAARAIDPRSFSEAFEQARVERDVAGKLTREEMVDPWKNAQVAHELYRQERARAASPWIGTSYVPAEEPVAWWNVWRRLRSWWSARNEEE